MAHITDYGGAIDDYYPARIERIADMELTELEKRADIEAEKSRMKPEALDGGWQPIETAPKDGRVILGFHENYGIEKTWFFRKTWGKNSCSWEPTHWMPLPEPPK